MPLSCPSLLSKAIPAHFPSAVIEPGTASDGIRSSQGPLKLSLSTGKCTSARRDYGFESALLRRPLPSNGKRAEMDSGTGSQVAFIVHRAGHGVIFALPRCSTHSKDTWRFRHGASVNSEEGGDPMTKLTVGLISRGNVRTTTLRAHSMEDFGRLAAEVP